MSYGLLPIPLGIFTVLHRLALMYGAGLGERAGCHCGLLAMNLASRQQVSSSAAFSSTPSSSTSFLGLEGFHSRFAPYELSCRFQHSPILR